MIRHLVRLLALGLILSITSYLIVSAQIVTPPSGVSFPLLAPNGSPSIPPYSFSNQPTTGLSATGTGTIRISGSDINFTNEIEFWGNGSSLWYMQTGGQLVPANNAVSDIGDVNFALRRVYIMDQLRLGNADPANGLGQGSIWFKGITFASLGTPSNGTMIYCTNCTIANPCAGAGTGAFAKRLNNVWVCN